MLESLPEQLASRLEQCALWVKRRASLPRGERGSEATAVRVEQREIVVEIPEEICMQVLTKALPEVIAPPLGTGNGGKLGGW